MRINIYSEELTERIEKVKTEANGKTFYGVRFYLKSPTELHNSPEDDDTSAVTFWHDDEEALVLLMNYARGAAGY